jgi:hypothetical protein
MWVGKQNSDDTVGTDWCSRPQLYVLCVCQQTSRTCRTELRHVSAQLGHSTEILKIRWTAFKITKHPNCTSQARQWTTTLH